jgi:hypothetical protein
MADEIDRAQDLNLAMNDMAAKHRKPTLPALGICHYCSEPVAGEAKFCDADCSADYDKEQLLRQRHSRE